MLQLLLLHGLELRRCYMKSNVLLRLIQPVFQLKQQFEWSYEYNQEFLRQQEVLLLNNVYVSPSTLAFLLQQV
ncbi:hypothetical protein D3C75_1072610 [compost metagenome]